MGAACFRHRPKTSRWSCPSFHRLFRRNKNESRIPFFWYRRSRLAALLVVGPDVPSRRVSDKIAEMQNGAVMVTLCHRTGLQIP